MKLLIHFMLDKLITSRHWLIEYTAHCVQKKIPTYVSDYNSGISWSIFILFISTENRNKYSMTNLFNDLRRASH